MSFFLSSEEIFLENEFDIRLFLPGIVFRSLADEGFLFFLFFLFFSLPSPDLSEEEKKKKKKKKRSLQL